MKLNNAPILDQLDDKWHKIVAFLLHKLVPRGTAVTITLEDMQKFEVDWDHDATVFVHGLADAILIKLVTREEADRIAAIQSSMNIKPRL